MNTNPAWSIAGVGHQTRHVAEEAARRAGMRLAEWLEQAIEQAAGGGARCALARGVSARPRSGGTGGRGRPAGGRPSAPDPPIGAISGIALREAASGPEGRGVADRHAPPGA